MSSVLVETKKLLGVPSDIDAFDVDIMTHINSVFMVLRTLGVGPDRPVHISGASEDWSVFSSDIEQLGLIKSYVYLKVRMLFDPPANSFVQTALEKQAAEIEWRLTNFAERLAMND